MDADCVKVIEVQKNFKSLTAKVDIPKGTFLGDYRGTVSQEKHMHTIQIGVESHLASVGNVIFANHSCSPNAQMVYEERHNVVSDDIKKGYKLSWHMVACRDIQQGEPISLDYSTTEYSMAEPFDCMCKSQNCLGKVQGFKFLSKVEKERRLPLASPVLQKLYEDENN